ncbi:MAG TPA: ribonuclease III domain-containing protein [Clostridia bacterium]|nr:ribonuclease III domain-containing protein [Clostridia bacterium]
MKNNLPLEEDLLECSISTLAWVGDAVFELFIRTRLAEKNKVASGALHREATSFVSAKGQAYLMESLMSRDNSFPLDDTERNLLQRARNFHTASTPKNVNLSDYRQATAFEALIGWLWLCGKQERVMRLMEHVLRESKMEGPADEPAQ